MGPTKAVAAHNAQLKGQTEVLSPVESLPMAVPEGAGQIQVVSPTPFDLLQQLISRGANLDTLRQFMDLQDRHEKNEARKAFVAAMSAFKANAITILRDKVNKQYNSLYVSLGNLVNTVTPYLSQNGLSVRWDIDQSLQGLVKVTCIITHAMGHSESVTMHCPPDKSGAKNPIQEIKSAITYAKGCTFESICGLASSDGNMDDDGNAMGRPHIDPAELEKNCQEIAEAGDMNKLKFLFTVAYGKAEETGDRQAMASYVTAKDKRKKELGK